MPPAVAVCDSKRAVAKRITLCQNVPLHDTDGVVLRGFRLDGNEVAVQPGGAAAQCLLALPKHLVRLAPIRGRWLLRLGEGTVQPAGAAAHGTHCEGRRAHQCEGEEPNRNMHIN